MVQVENVKSAARQNLATLGRAVIVSSVLTALWIAAGCYQAFEPASPVNAAPWVQTLNAKKIDYVTESQCTRRGGCLSVVTTVVTDAKGSQTKYGGMRTEFNLGTENTVLHGRYNETLSINGVRVGNPLTPGRNWSAILLFLFSALLWAAGELFVAEQREDAVLNRKKHCFTGQVGHVLRDMNEENTVVDFTDGTRMVFRGADKNDGIRVGVENTIWYTVDRYDVHRIVEAPQYDCMQTSEPCAANT